MCYASNTTSFVVHEPCSMNHHYTPKRLNNPLRTLVCSCSIGIIIITLISSGKYFIQSISSVHLRIDAMHYTYTQNRVRLFYSLRFYRCYLSIQVSPWTRSMCIVLWSNTNANNCTANRPSFSFTNTHTQRREGEKKSLAITIHIMNGSFSQIW